MGCNSPIPGTEYIKVSLNTFEAQKIKWATSILSPLRPLGDPPEIPKKWLLGVSIPTWWRTPTAIKVVYSCSGGMIYPPLGHIIFFQKLFFWKFLTPVYVHKRGTTLGYHFLIFFEKILFFAMFILPIPHV